MRPDPLFWEASYRIKLRVLFLLIPFVTFSFSGLYFNATPVLLFIFSATQTWVSLSFTIIIFLCVSSRLAAGQKLSGSAFQMSKKVGKRLANVMLTPWQLLMRWFIAAKHVYMGVRACARSSCQLHLPHPLHDEKKISYLIDCTPGLMVCMCTEEIPCLRVSTTTPDKISINHMRENPPNICGFGHSQPQEPQKS